MSKRKDLAEKDMLACNDVFADIVNAFLCKGKQLLDPDELSDCATASQFFVSGKTHEQIRDIAKYWTKAGVRIAIFGVENQSRPDADMPLRVIAYDGAAYKAQALQRDSARRSTATDPMPPYPVISIVINYGKAAWTKPKSLFECIGEDNIPEDIRPYVNDYKIHVLDIVSMGAEERGTFNSDFREVVDLVWALGNAAPYEPSERELTHPEETLTVISAITHDDKFLTAYNNIVENGDEGGISMCRITEEFEQRGIRLGEERGIRLGEERGIRLGEERGIRLGEERGIKLGEERGIRLGEQRGEEQTINIYRAYQQTKSIEETANVCGVTVEKVTAILKMMAILPV